MLLRKQRYEFWLMLELDFANFGYVDSSLTFFIRRNALRTAFKKQVINK